MRVVTICLVPALALLSACGSPSPDPQTRAQATVAPSASPTEAQEEVYTGADHALGMNTEITLDPALAAAWNGVRIKVQALDGGEPAIVDVPLGEETVLADSGLHLTATTFLPDMTMDESGIGSASPEPNNPAVQVVIREQGQDDYAGWLFAAMPEIHPFPHDRYSVTLVEGLPAS